MGSILDIKICVRISWVKKRKLAFNVKFRIPIALGGIWISASCPLAFFFSFTPNVNSFSRFLSSIRLGFSFVFGDSAFSFIGKLAPLRGVGHLQWSHKLGSVRGNGLILGQTSVKWSPMRFYQ